MRHLLCQCKNVQPIWDCICDKLCIQKLRDIEIIHNRIVENPRRAENCVVLLTKFYIYRTRCLKERISKESCINFIKHYVTIEEQIAKEGNKLTLHKLKWNEVENKL